MGSHLPHWRRGLLWPGGWQGPELRGRRQEEMAELAGKCVQMARRFLAGGGRGQGYLTSEAGHCLPISVAVLGSGSRALCLSPVLWSACEREMGREERAGGGDRAGQPAGSLAHCREGWGGGGAGGVGGGDTGLSPDKGQQRLLGGIISP